MPRVGERSQRPAGERRTSADERVERALNAASRRAEQLAARARIGMVVVALLIVSGLMLISRDPVAAGPAMLASIAVWAVYALVVERVLRRFYSRAIGFISVTCDLLALGAVSLATSIANGDLSQTTKTPWTYPFFLV